MNITLTGIKIVQDNKFLAFEKNSGVDVINITVDTDDEWTYKLDVKYPDKCCSGEALYNIINLTRTGNVCTAILTSDMLPFAGKYTMQLRGINGDKVAHSDTFDAWVKYSIEPGSTYDPVPSEFYQIEENITEMNNNPPYPSDDGYWMIWDVNTRVYKKSDIKIINGLPEISESTKDMALYNDGEKAEWREQRNPIPDWQENDPESPNYIRNRNGGYYTWGEENPIGRYYVYNGIATNKTLQFKDGEPDVDKILGAVIKRGDATTTIFERIDYFRNKENADKIGFYLGQWISATKVYPVTYVPSPTDITDIKVYDPTPVTWPSDLLPLADGVNPGTVNVSDRLWFPSDYCDKTYITQGGVLATPAYFTTVQSFEWADDTGPVTNGASMSFPSYTVPKGWNILSSSYLAGVLGLNAATDFPIQVIAIESYYGSFQYPRMTCRFTSKTGKSGRFEWYGGTGEASNPVLDNEPFIFKCTAAVTPNVPILSPNSNEFKQLNPTTMNGQNIKDVFFQGNSDDARAKHFDSFYAIVYKGEDTYDRVFLNMTSLKRIGDEVFLEFTGVVNQTTTAILSVKFVLTGSTIGIISYVESTSTGSDSDLLIVRFTQDGDTWSADKTYAEMKQALDDGKVVQGVIDDSTSIGYVNGDDIAFQFSLFHSENEQNRYFMYDAIKFIVSEDGIRALSNNDDLMDSYRRVILPAQTLLVTNNDGALSAKMIGPVEPLENPLTYLFNAFGLSSEYTIPTLTALYDTVPGSFTAERFYFSNAVLTPNSDNASAKIDFIFKSADATKTLTGSVTIPDGWDGYTPLDETWSYEEIAPFVFGCVTPPTPDGSVTSVTPLNDNYSKSLRAMIHILGGTTDDARAKSYSLFSAIVYTRGYECVCLSLTDFNIDPPDGRYTATFMGNVGKTRIARLSVTSRLTGVGVLDSSSYWETDGLDGAARYDEAQSLTNAQKQQARDNIGVVDIPAPSADNVGMVPVATVVDETEHTYGYEMKALADPRVTIFHVTGKGTTAEPYAMDITLEELTAAINAGNAVFATLDFRTFVAGETAAQNLIFQYQNTRTYATKTPQGPQYVFSTIDAPRTDNTYIRIPLMMVDTSTGSIAMNSIPTMLSIYSVLLYKGTDGAWKSSKTVHQIGDAMNSFCVLRMTDPDKRRYICTKNVYNNNANDLVECVCREGNTLYTATITESGVTMTEETLLPVSSDGTSFVLNSSTEGSTKRFKITVDDSGTLTAAEVTDETADA